ncbi:MAG: hypothetical protein AAFS10_13805, partial [Myxococcota bacterium]
MSEHATEANAQWRVDLTQTLGWTLAIVGSVGALLRWLMFGFDATVPIIGSGALLFGLTLWLSRYLPQHVGFAQIILYMALGLGACYATAPIGVVLIWFTPLPLIATLLLGYWAALPSTLIALVSMVGVMVWVDLSPFDVRVCASALPLVAFTAV